MTVDLGTTVTKVDLWDESGRLASGQAALTTHHPQPDRAEQDPQQWWPALSEAAGQARRHAPRAWAAAAGIGLAGARQSLVLVDARIRPIGPALLWSDRRAGPEAVVLAERFGGDEAVRQATGQPLRATSVAAKLAWLGAHRPDQVAEAELALTPRDWLARRLGGAPVTEPTMASASGCFERRDLERAATQPRGAHGPWFVEVGHARLLPQVMPLATAAGSLSPEAGAELGLPAAIPLVLAGGDRACEVLGTGASTGWPMVSWGTTANVSQPGWRADDPVPPGLAATRSSAAGPDGWQVEGGLSGAGSVLAWLAATTGRGVDQLMTAAAARAPGAGGVTVLPWFEGARAPWWRDDVELTIRGASTDPDPADLARAVLEGVATEVARILDRLEAVVGLELTGGGADGPAWVQVVAGVTGRPVRLRRSGRAAATGAALLTSAVLGQPFDRDVIDPVASEHHPDPVLVDRYRGLRPAADRLAAEVLDQRG